MLSKEINQDIRKSVQRSRKGSVKWETNTWRRNGPPIFRDETSLFETSTIYLAALFFFSDFNRKLFKKGAVILQI